MLGLSRSTSPGRSLAGLALLLLAACGDDGSSTTAGEATTTTAATATEGLDSATTGETATATATATATEGTAGESGDGACEVYAIGEWNACKTGPVTDNSKCNWESGSTAGEIRCLQPAGGGGSLCSIQGCESECDCFPPPATGTAIVQCAAVLADGERACVLNCSGDVTCPEGLECRSGYCYHPNP